MRFKRAPRNDVRAVTVDREVREPVRLDDAADAGPRNVDRVCACGQVP